MPFWHFLFSRHTEYMSAPYVDLATSMSSSQKSVADYCISREPDAYGDNHPHHMSITNSLIFFLTCRLQFVNFNS